MKLAALVLPLLTAAGARAGLPERATLWVEVVSADTGAPLEGVRLVITKAGVRNYSFESVGPLDGGRGKAPTTGPDGRARFRLYPRAYSLHVSWHAEGRWLDVPELGDGDVRTLRVELPTEDDVVYLGRVVARLPGAREEVALPGAEVLLYESDTWGSPWPLHQPADVVTEVARTATDHEGHFELRSASWKRRMIRIRAPGAAPGYVAVEPDRSDQGRRKVIRLKSSGSVVARVEGELPEGARLSLSLAAGGTPGSAAIGADGTCRIDELPAGVRLEARIRWPEPVPSGEEDHWFRAPFPFQRLVLEIDEPIVIAAGETVDLTVRIPRRCDVVGIVRDEHGTPLAGLTLRLERAYGMLGAVARPFTLVKYPDLVTADADGRFRIPDLPGETSWYLGPDPQRDEHFAAEGMPFTLPHDATEHQVEVRARSR